MSSGTLLISPFVMCLISPFGGLSGTYLVADVRTKSPIRLDINTTLLKLKILFK